MFLNDEPGFVMGKCEPANGLPAIRNSGGRRLDYREQDIAALCAKIIADLAGSPDELHIKAAALRAAAALLDEAIRAQAMLALVHQTINPKR